MRLLELTDGIADENPAKEYVDADSIARIEQFTYKEDVYENQVKTTGFIFTKTEETSVFQRTESRIGSIVYMKGKGKTYLRESPQAIIEMIKNKQFVVELQ